MYIEGYELNVFANIFVRSIRGTNASRLSLNRIIVTEKDLKSVQDQKFKRSQASPRNECQNTTLGHDLHQNFQTPLELFDRSPTFRLSIIDLIYRLIAFSTFDGTSSMFHADP